MFDKRKAMHEVLDLGAKARMVEKVLENCVDHETPNDVYLIYRLEELKDEYLSKQKQILNRLKRSKKYE
jgi:hypothetical protein